MFRGILSGRLTADPKPIQTQSGQLGAAFTMVTNRRWTNEATGEQQEIATFLNCTAWNSANSNLASNVLASLHTGDFVNADVRLEPNEYTLDATEDRPTPLQVRSLKGRCYWIGVDLQFASVEITRNPRVVPDAEAGEAMSLNAPANAVMAGASVGDEPY